MPEITVIDAEERWDKANVDEHLWWPRVLWIDPGVVSGVSVMWFDPGAVFAGEPMGRCLLAHADMFLNGPENGRNGQVHRFLWFRRGLAGTPGLVTGSESFVPRKLIMSQEFLAPSRIRSAIEYQLSVQFKDGEIEHPRGVELHVQSPSDAMGAFSNARLMPLRLHKPGPDHINDARRHCLLWIRKLRSKGIEHFERTHGDEPGWWETDTHQAL